MTQQTLLDQFNELYIFGKADKAGPKGPYGIDVTAQGPEFRDAFIALYELLTRYSDHDAGHLMALADAQRDQIADLEKLLEAERAGFWGKAAAQLTKQRDDLRIELALCYGIINKIAQRIKSDPDSDLLTQFAVYAGTKEQLEGQIEALAKFILANVPGEPSQSAGAVDTAIRVIVELQKFVADLEAEIKERSDASTDGLNKLWQEVILAAKPDYGDWEYPGQAYRHLKIEFDELKQRAEKAEARVADLEGGLRYIREHNIGAIERLD